ncbi:MAG: GatB/YqeY domain-containing protein [Alphaproteobacteria bacterium]|nr:GatB/YqeY domain-containing protein [Alphaproteobacteria bacterium]
MLREALGERLKTAMRAKDAPTVSAIRMIMAGLKDRDIAARGGEHAGTIPDSEILRMLQGMMKQRRESIAMYQQGNRPELAEKEEGEIAIIESFLPRQMDEADIAAAVKAAIADTGAAGIKDMGKVMAALRERHAGILDMAKAGAVVKQQLG